MEATFVYSKEEIEAAMVEHHRRTNNPVLGKQWQASLDADAKCSVVLVDVKKEAA